MTQRDLFSRAPAVDSIAVARLIARLKGRGWMTSKQLTQHGWWTDRQIRAIAHASHGQIIGGNRGYRLTLEASAEEINEVTGRLRAQREAEARRILDIEKVFHSRRVVAA